YFTRWRNPGTNSQHRDDPNSNDPHQGLQGKSPARKAGPDNHGRGPPHHRRNPQLLFTNPFPGRRPPDDTDPPTPRHPIPSLFRHKQRAQCATQAPSRCS
ncbi:MAG: hypothetical protein Q9183_008014, partial [Haloplaca sp. 2 TL-2023]